MVDIDRDGFDDFYYTDPDSAAFFFRNRGDGSFEEIADQIGLGFDEVQGIFFADFDNDGDSDAFLTYLTRVVDGTPQPGMHYLLNEDGRFVERDDLIDVPLPNLTLSISVADYDNDGLLDVYLGRAIGRSGRVRRAYEAAQAAGLPFDPGPPGFMSEEEWPAFVEASNSPDAHPLWNSPAPANMLLKNLGGGRFTRAPDSEPLELLHRTFMSVWSDVDRDGDMDLYVTNELSPNQLMINQGDGTFVDGSNETTGEVGWGMGTSVGDYDNDGRSDIYVTNMYSNAGMRIAEQMQSGAALAKTVRGNTLMRNGANGFEQVSGLEEPALLVEAAGFSWGGGFVDLNNDAVLDIYAPNGGVTQPKAIATLADT